LQSSRKALASDGALVCLPAVSVESGLMLLVSLLSVPAALVVPAPLSAQALDPQGTGVWDRAALDAAHEGALLAAAKRTPWPSPSAEALCEEGVVYVPNAVSTTTAAALRTLCEITLQSKLDAVASGEASYGACFGTVRARTARHDLKLGLEPTISDALAEALDTLGPLLSSALECDDPFLAALGAVGSCQGAPRQLMHADTRCFESPELMTAFIALQDIDEEMGPTTFLPGTHNAHSHAAMLSSKDELLSAGPVRLGAMPAGASTLYDPRVLHAGGANGSPRGRWLFYATFAASRSVADEIHGVQYAELQRAVHTVGTLRRSASKHEQHAGRSAEEEEEWAKVWAAMERKE